MTSSRGVRICSSRSGVSVATFVVVTGRRRWVLGVRDELAMIKLIESKLCMMNGGGDGGRGEGAYSRGLPVLLVFFVFATADDASNCDKYRPIVRDKTRGQRQINTRLHVP